MIRTVLLVSLLLMLVLSQDEEDVIIGIDLGTTYSCVSYWESNWDRVDIIPNGQGHMITPSVIAFNPENGELLVGAAAKNQAAMNPTNTVYDAKRFIGRRFDDPDIQDDIKKLPCKVVNVNGRPVFRLEIMGKERDFTPEEISAMVLQDMKQAAETFIGRPVTRAVITVPAYFNNAQRQATRVAGKIAGLKVERIINEPTAAAVAFGLRSKKNLNVLVFDLGGGTFDVSLMTIDSGVYDVIATSGDMHLGGEDFDHKILDQLILEFEKKHGTNLGANPRAIQKLKRATEEAKKSLSAEKHTEEKIYIDSLHRGIDFEFKLTRARLEHVNEEAFKRTLLPVEAVLKRSGMRKDEIDNILLVGGSTRIPKVKKLLADFFGGRQLTQEVQPDFVVSQGAAIVGAVIAKKIKHEIQLTDVLSQALGTEVVTGEMVTILETNAKIPTSGSKPFTTIQDNQKSVIVRVFQGEHKIAKNNQFLGEFVLSSIPPMKKGVPSIETTFTVDREGILHVTAVESTTGAKNSITIKDSLMLSPDEVSDAEIRHRDLVVRNQAIHNFNAELNKVDDKIQTVSATIKVTLENIRKTYENWFKEHPQATHKELDVKRESLLAEFKANMKAYGHDEL